MRFNFLLCLGLLIFPISAKADIAHTPRYSSAWRQLSGTFIHPRGVAVAENGDVYVTDASARVQKFNRHDQFMTAWGSPGSGRGEFSSPMGLAVNHNYVYVVDPDLARVQVFTTNGQYLFAWGRPGSGPGEFDNPYFIALNHEGDVYVVDNGHMRVQQFTPTGAFVRAWPVSGPPTGITVNHQGDVYVAVLSGRILQFGRDGQPRGSWAPTGQAQFNSPFGLSVDDQGDIYVADRFSYCLRKFNDSGTLLTSWGSYGQQPGQFDQPFAVAASHGGAVYVTDWGNHRVQVLGHPRRQPGQLSRDDAQPTSTSTWGQFKARYH